MFKTGDNWAFHPPLGDRALAQKGRKRPLDTFQTFDPLPNNVEFRLCQPLNGTARTPIFETQELTDLAEAKSQLLSSPNEPQTRNVFQTVAADAPQPAGRLGEELLALVEAHRLDTDAGGLRQAPNSEFAHSITLDSVP